MSRSAHEAVDLPQAPLRPLPEHLYEVLVASLRQSLGDRWGRPGKGVSAAMRRIRETVGELDAVYIAADLDHDDQHGVRVPLWVDIADMDLYLADDIVSETLRGLGDREILVVCRTFEDDGIHYRFASGSVEAGLTGTVVLAGPYARDVARLARIGSGQALEFSA